jgi:mono/diheme cytochrome c family protein
MSRQVEVAFALVLTLAVTACSRTASTDSSKAENAPVAAAKNPASANDGATIYTANCSSCHGADGEGVPGAFPPLARSPIVNGTPMQVIRIVKFGRSGKMLVEGTTYNGTMPHWGQLISDTDIAAVVSYIRTSWSNKAGAVSLADVEGVAK